MPDDIPKNTVALQLKTTAGEHRVGIVGDIARIVAWLTSGIAR
jgi:hypothetical protein